MLTGKYYGMDHDQYEDTVTKECIEEGTTEDGEEVYESQSAYNPFDIHMGQMTVYRLHISCSCSAASLLSSTASGLKPRCARILPFEEQPWSAYMGSAADSYFPFRPPASPLPPNPPKPWAPTFQVSMTAKTGSTLSEVTLVTLPIYPHNIRIMSLFPYVK